MGAQHQTRHIYDNFRDPGKRLMHPSSGRRTTSACDHNRCGDAVKRVPENAGDDSSIGISEVAAGDQRALLRKLDSPVRVPGHQET